MVDATTGPQGASSALADKKWTKRGRSTLGLPLANEVGAAIITKDEDFAMSALWPRSRSERRSSSRMTSWLDEAATPLT